MPTRNKENLLVWRENNKDRINEQSRKWAKAHPEKRRELNRSWIARNRDRYNASKFIYRDSLKLAVLKHYSKDGFICCVKCGFDNPDGLCLDHINNDGAQQRKLLKISGRTYSGGVRTYEALSKANFPVGLQILCANCNLIKEIERKRQNRMQNKFYVERINAPIRLSA